MILDVFKIVFEADTGKADDGIKRTEKSTDELVDTMQRADRQASSTGQAMAGLATRALSAFAAILSVGSAINGAIGRSEDIAAIERTSNALGIATEDVDAFGKSLTQLGGDSQGARDSLTDMAESIGEALQDVESGRAKTFGALKVSLRDVNGQSINAVEGLLRVADAVAGMSQGEAVFRIKELGITDNRTVEALLKGRKELERLMKVQKESNPLTKEQVERARQLTETMGGWRNSVGNAASQFFDRLIPALTKVVEWLTKIVDWAGEHQDFIIGLFIGIAGVVTAVYLPAMISAAAATLAATWPILAIAAAITAAGVAFALIYDDIMNFIDGNDSLIGQIFEKYPMVKDIIMGIGDAFKVLWLGAKQVFDFIAAGLSQVVNGIASVAKFFGLGGDIDIDAANARLAAASAEPMNSISSSAISNTANNNKETNVQIGEVKVETQATDSQGIGKSISADLSAQLKSLEAESATGIER